MNSISPGRLRLFSPRLLLLPVFIALLLGFHIPELVKSYLNELLTEASLQSLYQTQISQMQKRQEYSNAGDELLDFYRKNKMFDAERKLYLMRVHDYTLLECPDLADGERLNLAQWEIFNNHPQDAMEWLNQMRNPDYRLLAWCYAALNDSKNADACYKKAIVVASIQNHCGSKPNENDITSGIELDYIEWEFLPRLEYYKFLSRIKGREDDAAIQKHFCDEVSDWFPCDLKKLYEPIPGKPYLFHLHD